MKKIMSCFLSMILCFSLVSVPSSTVEAASADSIENNTIQLLAYEHPINLHNRTVEFKFVDQGNNTAKLKTFYDGKFIEINEIPGNLALYDHLVFNLTNIYGYSGGVFFDRATSMRSVARYLESLTFTYGVDAFQICRVPIILDHSTEGCFTFGLGGKIQGNLNNRDFNDAFQFFENGKEWRFRVRKNGLHAEYLSHSRLEDGEYYIETVDSANRVLDVQSNNNVVTNNYTPNATAQKVTLKFDDVNFATTIKFNGTNKYLHWPKNNGNNVIASDKMTSGDIGEQYWYLRDNGNGTYKIMSARQTTKFLNLDANNTNISVTNERNNTKQSFRLIKANERKSIVNSDVKIASKLNNNKVLNVDIGNGNGKNVTIWDSVDVNQQRFRFEYDQNKQAYRIRDCYRNGYLAWDADGKSTNVSTYSGYYDNGGYWTLEYTGDGYYYIKNLRNQNMVLTVTDGKKKNGTNIKVSKKNNTNRQKFKLIY